MKAKRQAVNQIKALLVTTDPALREELRSLSRRRLTLFCLQLSEGGEEVDSIVRATRFTVRVLAERIEQLGGQARVLDQRLAELIGTYYPCLLDAVGVGPHSAAVLLTALGDGAFLSWPEAGESGEHVRGEVGAVSLCSCRRVKENWLVPALG